jgi:hypothetical protein
MTRNATNKLLELLEEGMLDKDQVILACLKYMSEDDVEDMCECNEFFEVEEDEEDDGQPDEAQEWADFDPDC